MVIVKTVDLTTTLKISWLRLAMISQVFEQLQAEGLIYPLDARGEIGHKKIDRGELDQGKAVDTLYAVFSEYVACMPTCDRCFPEPVSLYRRLASISDVRKASVSDVSCLYWESPYCGGASNWKRFFPVMLLNGLWDHGGCDLFDRAVGAGMWAWPETEQTAIRDVVVSAFLEWSADSEAAPLNYDPRQAESRSRISDNRYVQPYDIGIYLVTAVLLCRVDPTSIYSYLLERNNSKARMLLARVINGQLNFWGWGVISDSKNDLGLYAEACQHLAQEMVGEERIIEWHMEADVHEATQNFYASVADRNYFGDLRKIRPPNQAFYNVFKEAFEASPARVIAS